MILLKKEKKTTHASLAYGFNYWWKIKMEWHQIKKKQKKYEALNYSNQ